jgi:hypothetical protein
VRCPGFCGGRFLDSVAIIAIGGCYGTEGYPPELGKRIIELAEGGCRVAEVAADLWISELETELAIHRRATELLKEKTSPKGRTRRSE